MAYHPNSVPRMGRRGMPEMKRLTAHLAEKYDRPARGGAIGQLGLLGFMYEVCNFALEGYTVSQITRALNHELDGGLTEDEVGRMCEDLEELGYLVPPATSAAP